MGNEVKAREYLNKLGFNNEGYTYVYGKRDSYDRRAELKADGFIFNKELLWHTPNPIEKYKDDCFIIHYTSVLELYTWGEGSFFPTVKDIISKKINEIDPEVESGGYVEPDDDNKIDVYATCTDIREVQGAYGLTNLIEFETEDGDLVQWWTTSNPKIEIGDFGEVKGNFKKNTEYKGKKATIATRVKFI